MDDAPRSGRPLTDTADAQRRVIAKARSLTPQPEGAAVPPTCHWTLDRLTEELNKDGIPIKRSQVRRLLRAEHLKWQKPRIWLESDDPAFAEKRGGSPGLIPLTVPEVRRLLLARWGPPAEWEERLRWSCWRRRHQERARRGHYARWLRHHPPV